MMAMVRSVTAEHIVRDTAAYLDFLAELPQTAGRAVGTTGYCMGGRLSLIVAGHFGERIAAAASFHGGNLADPSDPDSPHHHADRITAVVYVGAASNDRSFPDEQRDRLDEALTRGGVRHTIETYQGAHGFAITDMPTYDTAAAERHWTALTNLYQTALG
jgi:carboxymethylenebutenolidase